MILYSYVHNRVLEFLPLPYLLPFLFLLLFFSFLLVRLGDAFFFSFLE